MSTELLYFLPVYSCLVSAVRDFTKWLVILGCPFLFNWRHLKLTESFMHKQYFLTSSPHSLRRSDGDAAVESSELQKSLSVKHFAMVDKFPQKRMSILFRVEHKPDY